MGHVREDGSQKAPLYRAFAGDRGGKCRLIEREIVAEKFGAFEGERQGLPVRAGPLDRALELERQAGSSARARRIGAGVTGLTAAKEAVQSGLKTANIEALMFGGLVVNINELDGEPAGSGTDYASNLMMEISGTSLMKRNH